jgi:ribonucleotide monophosphatase NagD (HAD superfamily)
MLDQILSLGNFNCFLIDATGVLYNDMGPTLHIGKTIQRLQALGTVTVVTNNSSYSRAHISRRLHTYDVPIKDSEILSSGDGLLFDADLNRLVRDRSCFVFGNESSHPYVIDAGGIVCDLIQNSEVVLLMSSLKERQDAFQKHVVDFLRSRPEIPVICCNPDEYVLGPNDCLIPVMGYFAKQMEVRLDRKFIWMGKPYRNFSDIVRLRLPCEVQEILFFDDNPENVTALEAHLGLSGCVIRDTGLCRLEPWSKMPKPRFELSSLSFTM